MHHKSGEIFFLIKQEHNFLANVRGCSDDREITNKSQTIKKK